MIIKYNFLRQLNSYPSLKFGLILQCAFVLPTSPNNMPKE